VLEANAEEGSDGDGVLGDELFEGDEEGGGEG